MKEKVSLSIFCCSGCVFALMCESSCVRVKVMHVSVCEWLKITYTAAIFSPHVSTDWCYRAITPHYITHTSFLPPSFLLPPSSFSLLQLYPLWSQLLDIPSLLIAIFTLNFWIFTSLIYDGKGNNYNFEKSYCNS